jgi:hypothetical protein
MGLLTCRFPENGRPLDLAHEFKEKMAPIVIDIDGSDGFAASITKLESALDASGQTRKEFQPLLSMKRNADQYAPQYQLVLRVDQTPLMEGAINRRALSLTWNDPIPNWILTKVLLLAKGISASEIEAEDDAGNQIDIESVAHAWESP